jgi:predicted DNA-binding protein
MEIVENYVERRSKPVLVRLTPEIYNWLGDLAEEAGGGVATTIRSILEAAKDEGVSVITDNPVKRKK